MGCPPSGGNAAASNLRDNRRIATILMKSLHGVAITWIFYDGSHHFILGSRVPADTSLLKHGTNTR
jgi:hypothetical protein